MKRRGFSRLVTASWVSFSIGCGPGGSPDAAVLDAAALDGGAIDAPSFDAPAADTDGPRDAPAACVADLDCNTPPADVCVGADEHSHAEMGSCVGGRCEYTLQVRTCPTGCADGACASSCDAPTLETMVLDPARVAFRTSLALDGAGAPRIVAFPFEGAVRHYERPASAWSGTTAPGMGGGEGGLAVEDDGTAHIVNHVRVGDHLEVFYARRTPAGAWVEMDIPIGLGAYPAIALGPGAVPHVTYADGDVLRHAWREDDTWRTELVPTVVFPAYSDLVVSADGTVHVAVTQRLAATHDLVYAERTPSGAWSIEVAESERRRGHWPSIVVDAAGTIHIAHNEYTSPWAIYYTYRPTGGAWATEAFGSASHDPELALDPLGGVHVTFRDGYDLLHAVRTAADTWRTTLLHRGDTAAGSMSFAIDADGRGHVAYGSRTDGSLVYGQLTLCP